MDTNGIIQDHSKIKLALFKTYLESYLIVLLASQKVNIIRVHDVFAGAGITDDGDEGSAVIASRAIAEFCSAQKTKDIYIELNLNELDPNRFSKLKSIADKYSFVNLSNSKADEYIDKWRPKSPNFIEHNLFYLDPFGYTEINNKNLRKILKKDRCDCLFFLPIKHLRRFGPASAKNVLGLQNQEISKVKGLERFAKLIILKLKELSSTEFVYCKFIENGNAKHALFFITHHELGADKFLQAKKLNAGTKNNLPQATLSSIYTQAYDEIIPLMKINEPYTNTKIYLIGLLAGVHSSELMTLFKDLNKSGEVKVMGIGTDKRPRGLYLNYKHFSREDDRCTIMLVDKSNQTKLL